MTIRDPFFDVVKALAMLLVVIGHTRWAYGCQVGNPMIDNFIVGMNMPLFFMISGYFSAKTIGEGNWRKLGQHLVGYFWPVAVLSCVFAALAVAFGLEGAEKGLIGYAGRNFLFSPWYLWCLGICYALTFVACRLTMVPFWISIPALLLALPFVTGVWHMGNVRSMLPHFLFGMFALRRCKLWKNRRVGIPCLVVYLLVVLLSASFRKSGLSFYNGATDWRALCDVQNLALYVARTAIGFCGVIGILWVIGELVQKFGGGANSAQIWNDNPWRLHPAPMVVGALRDSCACGAVISRYIPCCAFTLYRLSRFCRGNTVVQYSKKSHLGKMVARVRI